jgi:hypothetical protein
MALSAKDRQAIVKDLAALLREDSDDSGVVVEAPAKPKGSGKGKGSRGRNTGPKASAARKPKKGCLSAGEAWIALGGKAEFEPKNPDKPANGAQLWALNAEGKLSFR